MNDIENRMVLPPGFEEECYDDDDTLREDELAERLRQERMDDLHSTLKDIGAGLSREIWK